MPKKQSHTLSLWEFRDNCSRMYQMADLATANKNASACLKDGRDAFTDPIQITRIS